jgi:hypothetical protein
MLALFTTLVALVCGACDVHGQSSYSCLRPDFGFTDPPTNPPQCNPVDGTCWPQGQPDPCHCIDHAYVGGIDYIQACTPPFWDPPPGCAAPGPCHPDGGTANDGAADGATDGPIEEAEGCTGACLPVQPDGWGPPGLLWIGAEVNAPMCPDIAPAIGYEGHADLDTSPAACGTCSCSSPGGSCVLPATMTASSSNACTAGGTGALLTPFDPPAGWDGSCDSDGSIPAGKLCGGVDCVRSVVIGPLAMTELGCTPAAPPATTIVAWKTFGLGCAGAASGSCPDHGEVCAAAASTPGFLTCIYHEGDVDCPGFSLYADQHVLYEGADDTRGCSPCVCGAPEGGACSSRVSIYTDGACSALLDTVTVDSSTECVSVPKGSPLGSKSATVPVYTAEGCPASGGQSTGSIVPVTPSTFCCLPP